MRIAVLALAFAVVSSTPALADPKDDAKPHITAADTAYKLGDFQKALDEYSAAYEIFKAPGLLFNIAQCHRNLAQFDKAIFFYEGYLRADPKAKNRALVEDLLKESRASLEKQQKDKADADAAAQAKAEADRLEAQRQADEAARERALAESKKLEEARKAREAHPEKIHFYQKWWFWTGVGVAAAAAGGTVYYFSGDTTYIDPSGTLGTLDRR
jgi:tetratricopeptide (TPR) repeat protein